MTEQPDAATDARPQTVPERLVAATIELLAQVGPSEIKVRRITEAAGLSTITVYHHFGGVAELLNAVVAEGYRALTAAMEDAVRCDDDPGAQLFGIALSNRHLAQRNPHLYDMMFGLSTRGTYRSVTPAAENMVAERFATAYDVLAGACHRLVETGRISVTDGHQVAAELWSFVHGFVTLEGAGHFARFANPVFEVLAPMAVHQFVGMGDERARAETSAATALRWWNSEGPGASGTYAIT
ncbi:MAG: TetR/AcrR family transcriptional regulator [Corynebacteriales bacterium]|uniref:TetR/AcrR family transcriptional regulator n=1 Tax=Williamsia herbipolensis TaxID=1603258 RepID=A0AAU4K0K9_9NOCA|nr:TetR/AcrR family transcriptional regulator [Williamsia herbipolensis]MCX6468856.1 TetR/AcrR family transcriptional regulator [Mycobacteriales bacterium]